MESSSTVPHRDNNSLVLQSKNEQLTRSGEQKMKKYKENKYFCILIVTEDFGTDPDPLISGTDPRIRIRTKISPTHLTISCTVHVLRPQGVWYPPPT